MGGQAGVLGTEPPCEEQAPIPEDGYIQPWMEFERSRPEEGFYATCGMVASDNPRNSSSNKKSKRRVLKSTKSNWSSKSNKSSWSNKSDKSDKSSKSDKSAKSSKSTGL